ncbi:MAG: FtsX-like permease family protein [Candidatus Pacebacteria bacterium]|nr:FtsX-like permease family protein [Candidatus Paceibacterota bacterium]MCF7863139.1 FtsX-like permease family protein [Candidatus Paceibacterota bacterium]
MKEKKYSNKKWFNTVRVAWFLAKRQIKGSNKSTTFLIVFIMTLTFLNLVVVSGILVGLIEGGNIANKEQYTGDVIITTVAGEPDISRTHEIESTLSKMQGIENISLRYIENGRVEANYKTRRDFSTLPDVVATQIAGIDTKAEDSLSNLSKYVVEGEYLSPNESGKILIGANLLRRYSAGFGDYFASLEGVYPGEEVKVTIDDRTKTFIVKGIVDTKVGEVSMRAFMTEEDFWRLVDRPGINANEIAVDLKPNSTISADRVKSNLVSVGFVNDGKIQTALEAIPDFLNQIKIAFSLLGNVIGLIGIVVASITIFIVIFINAVTRRKYIGIMKGIGISERAIEISYILQSIFYASAGGILGMIVVYALLVPFFLSHPLDFPFSDGILVAPIGETSFRFALLLLVTLVAGYIPARNIVKKNTLDSILGR